LTYRLPKHGYARSPSGDPPGPASTLLGWRSPDHAALGQHLRGMDKDSFDGPNAVMKALKGSLTGSND
jgi:hypothetical protein